MANILGTSWKTNLGAIGTALAVIATIITQISNGTFVFDSTTISSLVAAASMIFGLFSAKDNNVTGGTVRQDG